MNMYTYKWSIRITHTNTHQHYSWNIYDGQICNVCVIFKSNILNVFLLDKDLNRLNVKGLIIHNMIDVTKKTSGVTKDMSYAKTQTHLVLFKLWLHNLYIILKLSRSTCYNIIADHWILPVKLEKGQH